MLQKTLEIWRKELEINRGPFKTYYLIKIFKSLIK